LKVAFIPPYIANGRVARAMSAVGRGIRYRLGHGGTKPDDPLPTRTGYCDCSGFIAWVLNLNRAPKTDRPFWIETTNIVNDALGARKAFIRLHAPERGCLVVYPDRKVMGRRSEGHVGLVTEVGEGGRLTVIDCSSSKGGKVKEAIREWDRTALFVPRKAICVTLKQDLGMDK
jgi:cell wall-associated NlpC family hydrolase